MARTFIPNFQKIIADVYRMFREQKQEKVFPVEDLRGKLPTHPTARYPRRDPKRIWRIFIHHSLTSPGKHVDPAVLARAHMKAGRFGPGLVAEGIAYHRLIQPDGTIQRCWGYEVKTWHAGSKKFVGDENLDSVAICLIGDFDKEEPSEDVYRALVQEVRAIRKDLGFIGLWTHNQVAPWKSCPGTNFDIDKVRQMLGDDKLG